MASIEYCVKLSRREYRVLEDLAKEHGITPERALMAAVHYTKSLEGDDKPNLKGGIAVYDPATGGYKKIGA